MEKQFKKLYDSLLESGELLDMFPSMKGKWEVDKNRFVREQTELEELLNQDLYLDNDEY